MRKLGLPLRRILLSFFWVAALLGMPDLARAEDPVCQVTGLRGSATLEHAGARSVLAAGMALAAGDTITTGSGARVKLHFADGSEVRLGENARLRIDAVKVDAAAGTRTILLSLPLGLLRAAAAKLQQSAGSSFEIHTGIAYSAVRGTHWIVAARKAETRVYVQEGRVAVGADFATDQFPKLLEADRWVAVTRKAGIGAVQISQPGSVDGLIEETEASLAPGMPDEESETVTQAASNGVAGAAGSAVAETGNVVGGVGNAVAGTTNAVSNAVSNTTDAVADLAGGTVDQTAAALSATTGAVTSTLTGVVGTATDTVSGVVGSLGLPGGNTGSGSSASGSGSSGASSSGGSSAGSGSASGGSSTSGGSSSGGSSSSSSGGSSSSGSASGSGDSASSGGSSSGSGSASSSGGSVGGAVRDAVRAVGGLLK
jgi:hypothetical protein